MYNKRIREEKPTTVTVGSFTVIQTTNNHIQMYKDNRLVLHISCRKKMTEDELKDIATQYDLLGKEER